MAQHRRPATTLLATPRERGGVLVVVLVVVAVLTVVALLWIFNLDARPTGPGEPSPESVADQLAREKAAAWFAESDTAGHLDEARRALAPLLERRVPATEDLIAAAIVARAQDRDVDARELLARVIDRTPEDPRAQYMLARMEMLDGNFPSAAGRLRKVLQAVPDDIPAKIALAQTIEEDLPREAEQLYREVLERGIDNAGSWYVTAVFRLSTLMRDAGRDADFERYLAEFQELNGRGLSAPAAADEERGNLGNLVAPRPAAVQTAPPAQAPGLGESTTILPEFAGLDRLLPCDLDGDGDTDLVGWGARGVCTAVRAADGTWESQVLETEAIGWLAAVDLTLLDRSAAKDAPSALDVIGAVGRELHWWRVEIGEGGLATWTRDAKPLAVLPGPPLDGVALDFDHEGDLDLALVGNFGLRVLRNDGARSAAEGGGFVEVPRDLGAFSLQPFTWVVSEDFDTDQDVDLLCGGPRDVVLLSNLRGGRFRSVGEDRLQGFGVTPVRPLCADLDADGRPDLWGAGPYSLLYFNQVSATFRPEPGRGLIAGEDSRLPPRVAGEPWAGGMPASLLGGDFDRDGFLDAAWLNTEHRAEDVVSGQMSIGRTSQSGFDWTLPTPRTGNTPALADVGGDGEPELVRGSDRGVIVTGLAPLEHRSLRLSLRGVKDNRRGVGAVVELRAGGNYQRIYWRGEPTDIGVGSAENLDWLRVTWPNGVVQHDLRPELGPRTLEQVEGLIGSCPFLYSWNGSTYEFITDVIGGAPLGLPMGPGKLVPPDHDEYVLVLGEKLAPKDGRYELALTEELREVTYLDRLRLEVLDHPIGTEVYPNEMFCFPPFPLPHVHTVRDVIAPTVATGSDGVDWTEALARIDDRHAAPFQPAPAQMLGLCAPHWVELEFDRAALSSARTLRLVMTGWFYWSDASSNMASARDPGFEFSPPVLQIPDGQGGWRDGGPPIGFPAGKSKTMVIDVTDLLLRNDPRVRVCTTLRLAWDSIRLCTDDDDAPLTTTSLEPASAELWRRGFSEPVIDEKGEQPERFQWHRLAAQPRWNPHPGHYTRYGAVLPLVTAIDDQFVVMGSGDALSFAFDAAGLPDLPAGWRRDFLVFFDGWAKDRDHNSVEALNVEPLPFHGMSGYPYSRAERFPRTKETERWLREWQTRMPEPWIPRGPN